MRTDFLRLPRTLSLFDPLVKAQSGSRWCLLESEALAQLWSQGEDCHLGEDSRFQLSRWGRWCLTQQRPANQELINRLLQSWDGSNLESMLSRLDQQGGRSVVDLGDSRLRWDGEQLRLAHLPLIAWERPHATPQQGWLPLWRSSWLQPEASEVIPEYLQLRSPVPAHQFALYLDGPNNLGPLGSLWLCTTDLSGPGRFAWQDQQLAFADDGPLGRIESELLARDLAQVVRTEVLLTQPETADLSLEAALERLGRNPKTPSEGFRSSKRALPWASWLLDRHGALYCQLNPLLPPESLLRLQPSGPTYSPGDLLAVALPSRDLHWSWGEQSWTLPALAPDRVSLFRASSRSQSRLLQTRQLTPEQSRRWLVPASLRSALAAILDLPGVELLSEQEGWQALEVACHPNLLPPQLLDRLGLRCLSSQPVLELRGIPPVELLEVEDGELPAFLCSQLPYFWIDPGPRDAGWLEPHLLLLGPQQRLSLPLQGQPPWRVELSEAQPGAYRAQFLDPGPGLHSSPLSFHLQLELPTVETIPLGWRLGSSPWPPNNPPGPQRLEEIPGELSLMGPPCWPVQVEWRRERQVQRLILALDRQGRLEWSKLQPPRDACQLSLHLRGLASLELAFAPASDSRIPWHQLQGLLSHRFWPLRHLAPLSQCWEHLIGPVLRVAGWEPLSLEPHRWLLRRPGFQERHLRLARRSDWPGLGESGLLLSDGCHWAAGPEMTLVSLEDCLQRQQWDPLEHLLQGTPHSQELGGAMRPPLGPPALMRLRQVPNFPPSRPSQGQWAWACRQVILALGPCSRTQLFQEAQAVLESQDQDGLEASYKHLLRTTDIAGSWSSAWGAPAPARKLWLGEQLPALLLGSVPGCQQQQLNRLCPEELERSIPSLSLAQWEGPVPNTDFSQLERALRESSLTVAGSTTLEHYQVGSTQWSRARNQGNAPLLLRCWESRRWRFFWASACLTRCLELEVDQASRIRFALHRQQGQPVLARYQIQAEEIYLKVPFLPWREYCTLSLLSLEPIQFEQPFRVRRELGQFALDYLNRGLGISWKEDVLLC